MSSVPLRLLRGFLGLCFNSSVIRGIEWAVGPLRLKGREVPEEWERVGRCRLAAPMFTPSQVWPVSTSLPYRETSHSWNCCLKMELTLTRR